MQARPAHPFFARLGRGLHHLPALLGVVLLIGAIYVVQREYRGLKIEDIETALDAIPLHALAVSFGFTVLAYGVLTLYDRLGTIYAGHAVSYRRVAFASFCAYALSHNLGFAAVSGAAVRFRLYAHWGLTPWQIGKVVAFCSLTFTLGGMVLGGAILFLEPTSVPFFGTHMPKAVLYGAGVLLWAVVAVYVTLAQVIRRISVFGHELELPRTGMAVLQVLLATGDVAVTANIFHALLPHAPGLTFLRFLAVYVTSYTAGLAANLPGGIGVFDTAMLLGLSPYLDAPLIVGAVVVYRLYYYVIPLFLAGTLFAGNEILLRGRSVLQRRGRAGLLAAPTVRWSEPDFAVAAATGAVALCGFMLLSLGVLAPPPDLSWIDPDLTGMASAAGQYVPSLIGAALLVLAIGLSQRVTLAWHATLLLLLVAIAFTIAQHYRFWIPGVLILATFVIGPYRPAFYRHARLLSGPLQVSTALPLFALIVCVLMLANYERHVRVLTTTSWWGIVLSKEVPDSVRVTVALAVGVALIAAWRLLRPGHVTWLGWDSTSRLRYASLGGDPPSRADGIVLGETERSGIPFRRVGRVLLGLGDPVGMASDRVSAVWRLRDLAQQEGLDTAVYGAGESLLDVYGALGLAVLPLGPDGMPLPEMDEREAEAHRRAGQFLCCQAERDLAILMPLLPELAHRPLRQAAA